jgi:Ca2+-binding RTX toxin-like protein
LSGFGLAWDGTTFTSTFETTLEIAGSDDLGLMFAPYPYPVGDGYSGVFTLMSGDLHAVRLDQENITLTSEGIGAAMLEWTRDGVAREYLLLADSNDYFFFRLSGPALRTSAVPTGDEVVEFTVFSTPAEITSGPFQYLTEISLDEIVGVSSMSYDLVAGTSGSDLLSGSAGNDSLDGGDGDDVLAASAGNDQVNAGAGNDLIGGGLDDDTIDGGSGNDTIGAGQGHDQVSGGDDDDIVNGGAGNDTLNGDGGNDTMGGSFGADQLDGGAGNDNMGGGAGADSMNGGSGADSFGGGEGDDTINGEGGNDFLAGGGRHDVLNGGSGNDILNGGNGDDTMTGGDGNDIFVFNGFNDGDEDVITDFEDGIDFFRMSGVSNTPGTGLAGKLAALNISDVSGGAQIDYDGHTVLIQGVSASDLTLADFSFI